MSRSAERVACALLVTAALAQSACIYHSPSTYLKTTRLNVADAEPVHVASRLGVAMKDTTLHITGTPLCAPAKVGDYTIIEEERSYKVSTRGRGLFGLMAGVGSLVGAYYTYGTDFNFLSYELGISGGLFVGLGLVNVVAPDVRKYELPPDKHRAVTLGAPNQWRECGEPRAAAAAVTIEVKGGSETLKIETTTGNGTVELPPDLDAWSSSCDVELEISVTALASEGDTASGDSILSRRESIASLSSEEHTADQIRERLSFGETHIELGPSAGEIAWMPYLDMETRRFKLPKPTTTVLPPSSGGTEASRFAQACRAREKELLDKQRAEERARCIAPMEAAVLQSCRAGCTQQPKQMRCDVARDMCLDLTAGIEGSVRDKCEDEHSACLSAVGQDAYTINSCTNTCAESTYDAKCPR